MLQEVERLWCTNPSMSTTTPCTLTVVSEPLTGDQSSFKGTVLEGPAGPLGAALEGPAEPIVAILGGSAEPLGAVLEGPAEPLDVILEGLA